MKEKVFDRGEVIFRAGDTGESFFRVLEGTAGVYLRYGEENQQKLTDVTAGQFFGEMAVLDAWPRSTTVVAEDTLRVIEIGDGELDDCFMEKPEMIQALMCQLARRISELTVEYDEVNEVIREKKAANEEDEGLIARLKKIVDMNRLARANAAVTEEEKIRKMSFLDSGKDSSRVLAFKSGQIIFREGDAGSMMYAVYGGSVGIYINYCMPEEKKIATLTPDTFFGEMGLLLDEPRSATAVVEADNTLLECIRKEDLEVMLRENPIKAYMIVSHLTHRLRQLTRDYVKACAAAAGEEA